MGSFLPSQLVFGAFMAISQRCRIALSSMDPQASHDGRSVPMFDLLPSRFCVQMDWPASRTSKSLGNLVVGSGSGWELPLENVLRRLRLVLGADNRIEALQGSGSGLYSGTILEVDEWWLSGWSGCCVCCSVPWPAGGTSTPGARVVLTVLGQVVPR